MRNIVKSALYASTALSLSLVAPAFADTSLADDTGAQPVEEVVVTGTLIRGVTPPGAEIVGISSEDIVASGAVSSEQVLATVPQASNFFNTVPQVFAGTDNQIQIERVNLHNLPDFNASSGTGTLVLVDGHRIVGAGVDQDAVDTDVVPPAVVDRVEILADGASSTYGADAVSGVVNFITKKNFDGVQVAANYGAAADVNQINTSLTAGQDWGTGSAYLSYSYSFSDGLAGRDRGYVKNINWVTGQPTDNECPAPNVVISGTSYAYPGLTPGTNVCDPSRYQSIFPEMDRNSVFFGATQDVTSWLNFDLRSFYTVRTEDSSGGISNTGEAVTITNTNPYYMTVPGHTGATQTVDFNLAPVFGNNYSQNTSEIQEWGVTPTLTAELGDTWEVRAMFNYGQSTTDFFNKTSNATLLTTYAAGTTTATALDPYNIALTNPQLLANIEDQVLTEQSNISLTDTRVIADGQVFTLPAGPLHAAFGSEYLINTDSIRNDSATPTTYEAVSAQPTTSYTQRDEAFFGELEIPVFGKGFTLPMVDSFVISASARYDHYTAFGTSYNPKAGATYKPVDWISIKGNWGTSFDAPTPVDELGVKGTTVFNDTLFSDTVFYAPPVTGAKAPANEYVIALSGTKPGIKPQTAETHSFGLDVSPPFIPGLTGSVEYYFGMIKGLIGKPPITNGPQLNADGDMIVNPTLAQVQAFTNLATNGPAFYAAHFATASPPKVAELIYYELSNIGNAHYAGMDWSVAYAHDTEFGSMDAKISASNLFESSQNNGPGTAYVSMMDGVSSFHFSGTVGADIGSLRAQVTLLHTQGFTLNAGETTALQNRLSSFDVVNFFFRYGLDTARLPNVGGLGLWDNAAITLNIDNVMNANPPVYMGPFQNGQTAGTLSNSGSTYGRMFEIGLIKKF